MTRNAWCGVVLASSFCLGAAVSDRAVLTPEKKEAFAWVDQHRDLLTTMTDRVWELAELPMEEYGSSRLLADALEKEGFRVERGVAGTPTAFVANYGAGEPILGRDPG